jgi:hypothetical protein
MPNVNFRRGDFAVLGTKYQLIRDCLAGAEAVKLAREKYLPIPNPTDTGKENLARYDGYLERAVFYAVAGNTLNGLVGTVFAAEPVAELPTPMQLLQDNADGAGVGLTQMAKKTLGETLAMGRYGLFVDYPNMGAATRQDVIDGTARPVIAGYGAESIINWRTITRGAKTLLSLVVIEETAPGPDDGFEIKFEAQWRTLWLDNDGNFKVEIWRKKRATPQGTTIPNQSASEATANDGDFYIDETYYPLDGNGNLWREIPFQFVGSLNNDWNPDYPPMYSLCVLNMAHYRNSADYEHSCYMVGQPTLWASGLTKDWVDNVLGGEIHIGSSAVIPLPRDGSAGILQVQPNTLPMEAMLHKEKQMVAIGAKLVEQRDVQRTLGEAQMDNAAQTSTLSTVAKNTGAAFEQALRWCAQYMGIAVTDTTLSYVLSTDFAIDRMSPQERAQLIAEWQGGGITWKEYRNQLRQSGIATEDDDAAKEEIDNESQKQQKLALDAIAESAAASGDNADPGNDNPDDAANDGN